VKYYIKLTTIKNNMKKELLSNISKIHTTELGIERIKKNLNIDVENVVEYCINLIKKRKFTNKMQR
jgi:hypothetical protein